MTGMEQLRESWTEAQEILKESYVIEGDFTLSSGQHSDLYVDVKSATTEYGFMKHIVFLLDGFIQAFQENDNLKKEQIVLAGLESGAIPLLTGLQMRYRWGTVWARKGKDHGLKNNLVGYLDDEDKVVIVEDVIMTGMGINKVANTVGIDKVLGIVCVVNRSRLGDRINLTDAKTFENKAVDVRSVFEMKHLWKP
jgi:orotate phosphoribosyltransferase